MVTALYRGFSSFEYESTGDFKITDLNLVKLDLLNHIFTRRGERVMMPSFGTSIPDLTFEPLDDELVDELYEELIAVFEYDPRVELLDLNIVPNEDENRVTANAKLFYIELNLVDVLDLNIQLGEG